MKDIISRKEPPRKMMTMKISILIYACNERWVETRKFSEQYCKMWRLSACYATIQVWIAWRRDTVHRQFSKPPHLTPESLWSLIKEYQLELSTVLSITHSRLPRHFCIFTNFNPSKNILTDSRFRSNSAMYLNSLQSNWKFDYGLTGWRQRNFFLQ